MHMTLATFMEAGDESPFAAAGPSWWSGRLSTDPERWEAVGTIVLYNKRGQLWGVRLPVGRSGRTTCQVAMGSRCGWRSCA